MKNELGSAGLVVLLIMSVTGLLASGTVHKLDEGKVKVNKEVVKERKPVDYKKMND